jgi:PKD repeat protein
MGQNAAKRIKELLGTISKVDVGQGFAEFLASMAKSIRRVGKGKQLPQDTKGARTKRRMVIPARRIEQRIARLRERMHKIDLQGGDTYGIEDEIELLRRKLLRTRRWGLPIGAGSLVIVLGLTSFGLYTAIRNYPPVAAFTAPSHCETGQRITLDAAASYDRDGSIRSYTWRIHDEVTLVGERVVQTFTQPGRYNVQLTVEDNRGKSASAQKAITVEIHNDLPTARFSYSPAAPNLATTVTFDGSDSTDPDGSIVSYRWEFSDEQFSCSGIRASRRFPNPGLYSVQLTVTDNRGAEDTFSRSITVHNEPPAAHFIMASKGSPKVNRSVRFDASSSSDADGALASYTWWFGDGSTSSGEAVSHVYRTVGLRTVTLEVTDDRGSKSRTSRQIEVQSLKPPHAVINYIGPVRLFEEDIITFLGLLSWDDGAIVRYEWRLSDGSTNEDSIWPHVLQNRGTYTITLTVTDNDGLTNTTSRQFSY